MSCPKTGLIDFPIQNTVPINTVLLQKSAQDQMLDIQWGTRSTAPVNTQGILDEGVNGTTSQTTTLRLNSTSYNLHQVQLCTPLHTSFNQPYDTEVVMIFSNGVSYTLLCIPIKNAANTTPSAYLTSLANGALGGSPVSLSSLLPSDLHYLNYQTCLTQTSSAKSLIQNVNVILFTSIVNYSGNLVKRTVALPDGLVANTTGPYVIATGDDFNAKVKYGLYTVSSTNLSPGQRQDATNAYKCVPLLPEQNVHDGKITVDTTNGTLLSKVLEDKIADTNAELGNNKYTPGDVEKIIAIIFGTLLGLFLLSILVLFLMQYTSQTQIPIFDSIKTTLYNQSPMILGIILGIFLTTLIIFIPQLIQK